VVTIDNSTAHLAGALGVPAFVLLPFVSDWRWLQAREDSPWYPSLRLLRQPKRSDWQSVVQTVHRCLVSGGADSSTT
jgi:ADP-heptose:LPS heptosyltransferase